MCAAILDQELDQKLLELTKQWDIAERRIKEAEKHHDNEVISPAVYELRYAGRKIVDALLIGLNNDWRNDSGARGQMNSYLADAIEDCVKAKHDAIDAMLDFITIWLQDTEEKLGLDELPNYFPKYFTVTGKISEWNSKIIESRSDRVSTRQEVYNDLEKNDFREILDFYVEMKNSEKRVELAIAARENKKQKLFDRTFRTSVYAAIIGAITGALLTIAASYIMLKFGLSAHGISTTSG